MQPLPLASGAIRESESKSSKPAIQAKNGSGGWGKAHFKQELRFLQNLVPPIGMPQHLTPVKIPVAHFLPAVAFEVSSRAAPSGVH